MYRIFFRKLCGNRLLESYFPKKYLKTVSTNLYTFSVSSFNTMPPKRKVAPARHETADVAAGGDQAAPAAPKAKKGRPKKEPKSENQMAEEETKMKANEEVVDDVEQEEQKKTKKKPAAKGKNKETEKPIPVKKTSSRTKKVVEVEESPEEVDVPSKVTKRGRKKEDEANGVEVTKEKVTRKKKADTLPEEPKPKGRKKNDKEEKAEKPAPSNSTITNWEKINFDCKKQNGEGKKANLKISCWNVGGLKSWVKKDCMKFLEYEDPDILCFQETKCSEDKLPDEIKELEGYNQYWCGSNKEGYAGVGLLCKEEPLEVTYGINDDEQDEDGRCITAEFDDYYVVCVYVPNAGRKLVTLPKRLEWNASFKDYIKSLDEKKPVIICGDMNVSHSEIDLARPANNTKNAGFTQEERDGMTDFLQEGYIDTFRKLYPDKTDVYTFWTYMAQARSKNIGWRLDYFIVSERIMDKVCDNVIRSEILGSDHCPMTLFINI